MACPTIRLDPEQLRQLARLVAVDIRKHGQPVERLPEDLTPKQAAEYTGRCKRAIFYFMKDEPAACVIDGDGIRRVNRRWLDAWCAGEHALAAMRRAARA